MEGRKVKKGKKGLMNGYDKRIDHHSCNVPKSLCRASSCSSALQMPKMDLLPSESSIIQFNIQPSPLDSLQISVFMPSCSKMTSFSTSEWFIIASLYFPNLSASRNMGPRTFRQFQCLPSSSQRAITTNLMVRRIFSVLRRLTSRCRTRRFMAITSSFAFIDSGFIILKGKNVMETSAAISQAILHFINKNHRYSFPIEIAFLLSDAYPDAINNKKMNPMIKQPNVKLIPSDPMTNTILIIYCVSSTGVSVPYKSLWRKINPKKNKVEEIKSHNGSSYRCSPLDLDCIIEATVFFQFQNMQMQKVVQSNMVKVSRELKERRAYLKDPIPCKISIDEMPIEVKVLFQEGILYIFPANNNIDISFGLHCNDFIPEADTNQHIFRIFLKNNFDDFLSFFSGLLGWRPQIRSQFFVFTFASDINRDIILLGFAEIFQRMIDLPQQLPIPRPVQQFTQLQKSGHSKNRSKTSLSPVNKDKIKVNEKVQMKKSQSNLTQQKGEVKKNEAFVKENKIALQSKEKKMEIMNSPTSKAINKDKSKEPREYLNVFESDDQELLSTPIPKVAEAALKANEANSVTKSPNPQAQNQPSINLRGSFEELQRSFSNNNEEAIQKAFGNNDANSKKMADEIARLKRENDELKKQAETVASLTKENMTIKKKYHELKQEINRLQMQRKVILTDKLRCEVNWHKESQEKQFLKKELETLKEVLKGSIPFHSQNQIDRIKSTSIHDMANTERQKERNRSPNSSFYNK